MRKYKKNYLKYHGLTTEDWIGCEECGKTAVDLHHRIKRSQGGSDEAENLVPLCRECHMKYH